MAREATPFHAPRLICEQKVGTCPGNPALARQSFPRDRKDFALARHDFPLAPKTLPLPVENWTSASGVFRMEEIGVKPYVKMPVEALWNDKIIQSGKYA